MTITPAPAMPQETPTENAVVVWVHGDHLGTSNSALAAYPRAPAVFVFDEDFIGAERFAFHRLFFIYESVLDLFKTRRAAHPDALCSVRRGRVPDEVLDFARQHGAARIVTTATLGDRFALYKSQMEQTLPVDALEVPSLVRYDPARVPRRYSVWWREVEGQAMR